MNVLQDSPDRFLSRSAAFPASLIFWFVEQFPHIEEKLQFGLINSGDILEF